MTQPALTVAIPFYRGQAYLRRAIASVLGQTDPAWELLVCDDGGLETGVSELIASYEDRRLRYHRNPTNLGMASNWNRCLDLAQTDLVALLHADDELLPRYVALMRQATHDHTKAVAFFCGAQVIDARGVRRFSLPDAIKSLLIPRTRGRLILRGDDALARLLRGNFIFCPSVCYRRQMLATRRFQPRWSQVQDLELFSRLLIDGDTIVGLPERAYSYRRHAENATAKHTASLLRFDEECRLYDDLSCRTAERGWMGASRVARRKRMVKLNLAYCSLVDGWNGHWGPAARKAAFLWQLTWGHGRHATPLMRGRATANQLGFPRPTATGDRR